MNDIRPLTLIATACLLGAAALPAAAHSADPSAPRAALPATAREAADSLLQQRREQRSKAAEPIAPEQIAGRTQEERRKREAQPQLEDAVVAAEQQRLVAAALLRLARNAA